MKASLMEHSSKNESKICHNFMIGIKMYNKAALQVFVAQLLRGLKRKRNIVQKFVRKNFRLAPASGVIIPTNTPPPFEQSLIMFRRLFSLCPPQQVYRHKKLRTKPA